MKWPSLCAAALVTASLAGCSDDESNLYGTKNARPATGGVSTGGALPTGGLTTGGLAAGGTAASATTTGGTATGGQTMTETGGTGAMPPQTGGTVPCPTGSETCPCTTDGTCDAGLTCASGLCVDLGGVGGTGGIAAGGGAPSGGQGGGATGGLNSGGTEDAGGAGGDLGTGGDLGEGGDADAGGEGGAGQAGSAATGGTETGGAPSGGAPPGGAETGGAPTGGGGGASGGCSTAQMDPCSVIPYFAGTQTVDGDDSDLCTLPSFVLDFIDNNDFVHVDHPGSNDPDNRRPESATVRLGWSNVGLHAFITVSDPYRVPPGDLASIYDGDGIELFFTQDTSLVGNPAVDSATHAAVTADPTLAAAVSTMNGTASHTPLATGSYETTPTAGGYTVELRLPWVWGAPSSGAQIAFDLALNSADNDPEGAPDGRDAQAILYLGTLSAPTTCNGEARPWCDDRTWCRPTLE